MRQFATDLFKNGKEGDVLKKNSDAPMDFGFGEGGGGLPEGSPVKVLGEQEDAGLPPEVYTLNKMNKVGLVIPYEGKTVELSFEGEEGSYSLKVKVTNTFDEEQRLLVDLHLIKCKAVIGDYSAIEHIRTYDRKLTINKLFLDAASADTYIDFTFDTEDSVAAGESAEATINISVAEVAELTVDTNDLYTRTELPIAAASNE